MVIVHVVVLMTAMEEARIGGAGGDRGRDDREHHGARFQGMSTPAPIGGPKQTGAPAPEPHGLAQTRHHSRP